MRQWQFMFAEDQITVESGKLAKQANASVLVRSGGTVVLVTAAMSEPREGISYFPLMVNYEEREYAIGKIPGSIMRREGRPRDAATLAARLIDRPLRPLFPEGFRHDVQVIATVLSVDSDYDPEILAMNGASMALMLSDIPFDGPIGGVRVGLVDGEFVVNPKTELKERSLINLIVAGTKDAVMMVEAGAKVVSEEQMLGAIMFGHEEIKKIVAEQEKMQAEAGKPKIEFEVKVIDEALEEDIREKAYERLNQALRIPEKQERNTAVSAIIDGVVISYEDQFTAENLQDTHKKLKDVKKVLNNMVEEIIRKLILVEKIRPDGRKTDEIRPISCEVGLLPRVHGSGLFTRGQTQALSVVTLGAASDEQILFGLGEEETKRFMHHYNFPPYSVGEVRPIRSPGRREIGHGALGERAIEPVIPTHEEFPYTIRLVSEVLESNGSSSQASICGSILALMDGGVPIKAPVAGIAMGLMGDGEQFVVLSDIQGAEDHYGDMDFKVAGTQEGITALQMDIKIAGVSREVLAIALEQAKIGRLFILGEMLKAISEPRSELSPYAPSMITLKIDPEKIRYVIGPGGKMIKKIVEETGVKIDIEDDGSVFILSTNQEDGETAREIIYNLTRDVVVGDLYLGKVKKAMNFGAFIEIVPGQEGLCHISKLAKHHVKNVEDIVKVGDEMWVKVVAIDDQGRINLSRKDALEEMGIEDPYAPKEEKATEDK
ncbi:MAG: polyribonucleotide nucleotidyltransferase [Halanaerobiales bacterium]|nr:polyribonucleotide nucleotidyltransferase [Halanaerobiales bacterium]